MAIKISPTEIGTNYGSSMNMKLSSTAQIIFLWSTNLAYPHYMRSLIPFSMRWTGTFHHSIGPLHMSYEAW